MSKQISTLPIQMSSSDSTALINSAWIPVGKNSAGNAIDTTNIQKNPFITRLDHCAAPEGAVAAMVMKGR